MLLVKENFVDVFRSPFVLFEDHNLIFRLSRQEEQNQKTLVVVLLVSGWRICFIRFSLSNFVSHVFFHLSSFLVFARFLLFLLVPSPLYFSLLSFKVLVLILHIFISLPSSFTVSFLFKIREASAAWHRNNCKPTKREKRRENMTCKSLNVKRTETNSLKRFLFLCKPEEKDLLPA